MTDGINPFIPVYEIDEVVYILKGTELPNMVVVKCTVAKIIVNITKDGIHTLYTLNNNLGYGCEEYPEPKVYHSIIYLKKMLKEVISTIPVQGSNYDS